MSYRARLEQFETRRGRTDRTDRSTFGGFVSSYLAHKTSKSDSVRPLEKSKRAARDSRPRARTKATRLNSVDPPSASNELVARRGERLDVGELLREIVRRNLLAEQLACELIARAAIR